jgi:steroid delta-isomerase-like uncharacterized protein
MDMATAPETPLTAPLSATEAANLHAVADVLRFWNAHDVPGVLAYYDDEIAWHNIATDEVFRGKEAVRGYLTRLLAAFPDLQFAVLHKIARGNNVAEQWVIRGTHRGTFMGIPPTGRPVHIPGMSMLEMRGGKFLSDHFYFDSGTVMRQLGLLPPLSMNETFPGRVTLWLVVKAGALLRFFGLGK